MSHLTCVSITFMYVKLLYMLLRLYLSFPMTFVMNIPYGGIMVAVNESMKKVRDLSFWLLHTSDLVVCVCMYVGIRY